MIATDLGLEGTSPIFIHRLQGWLLHTAVKGKPGTSQIGRELWTWQIRLRKRTLAQHVLLWLHRRQDGEKHHSANRGAEQLYRTPHPQVPKHSKMIQFQTKEGQARV